MFYRDELGHKGPSRPAGCATSFPEIQYLDVKQINDRLGEYEQRIAALMDAHRKLTHIVQGRALRTQITVLWQEYIDLTAQAEEMTALYLVQLAEKRTGTGSGGKYWRRRQTSAKSNKSRRPRPPRLKRT